MAAPKTRASVIVMMRQQGKGTKASQARLPNVGGLAEGIEGGL